MPESKDPYHQNWLVRWTICPVRACEPRPEVPTRVDNSDLDTLNSFMQVDGHARATCDNQGRLYVQRWKICNVEWLARCPRLLLSRQLLQVSNGMQKRA